MRQPTDQLVMDPIAQWRSAAIPLFERFGILQPFRRSDVSTPTKQALHMILQLIELPLLARGDCSASIFGRECRRSVAPPRIGSCPKMRLDSQPDRKRSQRRVGSGGTISIATTHRQCEFTRAAKKIGLLNSTSPKVLRHQFATILQEGRVDPLVRNLLMGHAAAGERTGASGV